MLVLKITLLAGRIVLNAVDYPRDSVAISELIEKSLLLEK